MNRIVLTVMILLAIGGCYTGAQIDWNGTPVAPEVAEEDPPTKKKGDIPCDVLSLLNLQCVRCHGPTPSNGALNSLNTYGDLLLKNDDGVTGAELSVNRMKDKKKPMPPDQLLGADQVKILQNWVDDGYPSEKCVVTPDASAASQ